MTHEAYCIFEGILKEGTHNDMYNDNATFHSFKINSTYITATDFNAWDNLAACKSLHHISVLEFDLINQWLSTPTEKFIATFQQLPTLILNCRCTGGFHNLINDDTLKRELQEKLPNTTIVINLNVDYGLF